MSCRHITTLCHCAPLCMCMRVCVYVCVAGCSVKGTSVLMFKSLLEESERSHVNGYTSSDALIKRASHPARVKGHLKSDVTSGTFITRS